MPHVMVKVRSGTPEDKKKQLAEAIVEDVVDIVGSGRESISVAIEEVDPKDWKGKVYDPLIYRKKDTLYKKPGYSM
ncbi:MAG: tautomerase family protein [Thermodesulfobacteriota bacterium]